MKHLKFRIQVLKVYPISYFVEEFFHTSLLVRLRKFSKYVETEIGSFGFGTTPGFNCDDTEYKGR